TNRTHGSYRSHETDNSAVLNLDVRIRIIPLPEFLLELAALVHDDLAVVADGDGPAFQRPRGGAFEVHAGDVEAAAVAGALELLVRLQPVGRAAEVRAGRAQGVNLALVLHDPHVAVFEVVGDLTFFEIARVADLHL